MIPWHYRSQQRHRAVIKSQPRPQQQRHRVRLRRMFRCRSHERGHGQNISTKIQSECMFPRHCGKALCFCRYDAVFLSICAVFSTRHRCDYVSGTIIIASPGLHRGRSPLVHFGPRDERDNILIGFRSHVTHFLFITGTDKKWYAKVNVTIFTKRNELRS